MPRRALFEDVQDQMQPGDVIAFGGSSWLSRLIKWFTMSEVSHVGCVCFLPGCAEPHVVESTRIKMHDGVNVTPLAERMDYAGEVWWLALHPLPREQFDVEKFNAAIEEHLGKFFDWTGLVKAGIDWLDSVPALKWLTLAQHDARKFFCSELVMTLLSAGLKNLTVINAAEVQPREVCQFMLWQPDYFQLKGEPKEIEGFNSVVLEG